ncbi:hypothetical protein RW64_18470 [Geobacter sulfurreducens]|nr:hypothetical protein RW64_18470 [Geobacter sulfurreducens]
MHWAELYQSTTDKPLGEFVAALAQAGRRRGFVIHNEEKMEMAHTFGSHGVAVGEGFDLHMIQVCKPEKAAMSLQKNPERAALMPKFITTFTRDGETLIRMLRYRRPMIEALVDDREFAASIEESFDAITAMIEEAR